MKGALSRRAFIAGASAMVVGVLAILEYRNSTRDKSRDVDRMLRDYKKYLDAVAADYRAGRVTVVDGWIVSVTEANDYAAHQNAARRLS